MKKTIVTLAIGCMSSLVWANPQLTALTDEQLSLVDGAALLNMVYTAPDQTNAAMRAENIGFYKLAMNADMEINVNIAKLQLGCGGDNGPGCDIDIDHLSLSGLSDTSDGRASSSALINNPFIEFAIKNPNAAATREVVGFRLSAEKVQGLLTTGIQNSNVPNGINTLSGYMKVQSDSSGMIKGLATTAATRDNLYGANAVRGRLQALNLGGLAEVDFETTAGGFNIPEIRDNPFTTPAIVVNGKRLSYVNLTSRVNVPDINLGEGAAYPVNGNVNYNANGNPTGVNTQGGLVTATVRDCNLLACLLAPVGSKFERVYMNGTITGIKADLNLKQSLGLIHSLPLNSAMSLSLQTQPIHWLGANDDDIAQHGWWRSAKDPVNIGDVIPQNAIVIDQLFPQISEKVSEYLQANPVQTTDLGGLLKIGELSTNIGTINLSNSPLKLNVENLSLRGQDFAPNCFGGYKFC